MSKNIESKIAKLLEMATKGTKHEQTIAMVKAQELMLKHHIEMDDVKLATREKIIKVDIDDRVNCYSEWTMRLVGIMAKNFRCHAAYCNIFRKKGKRRIAVILGFETDVGICKMMIEDGFNLITKLSKSEVNWKYRNGESVKGVKEAYINGFLKGLVDGFEELIASNNKYALIIQEPIEVKEEASRQFKFADFKTNNIQAVDDESVHEHGYIEGKNYAKNKKTKGLDKSNERIEG